MDTLRIRSRRRDEALWQVGAWTRRIAAVAVILCAALMAGFSHVLPSIAAHLSGLHGSGFGTGTNGQTGQAPGAGSGSAPQVRSGAS